MGLSHGIDVIWIPLSHQPVPERSDLQALWFLIAHLFFWASPILIRFSRQNKNKMMDFIEWGWATAQFWERFGNSEKKRVTTHPAENIKDKILWEECFIQSETKMEICQTMFSWCLPCSACWDRQGDKQSTVRFPKELKGIWKEPGTKNPDINIEVYQYTSLVGIKVN